MTPSKKMLMPQIFFLVIFSENVGFFEKIIRWKHIQNLISKKKNIYSLTTPDAPFPSKETWSSETVYSENTAFFEKAAK